MHESDDHQLHPEAIGRGVEHRGPTGAGADEYLESEEGQDWSHSTGEAAAQNLVAVARALAESPMEAPPGE